MKTTLLAALAVTAGLCFAGCQAEPAAKVADPLLLVGTYSNEAGKGLQLLRYDSATDEFAPVSQFADIENASFGVYDAENRRLYVTDERDDGRVAAYDVATGDVALKAINAVSSGAGSPCYLALSPDKRRLAVANYQGDVVAIYAIDPSTGAIDGEPQILKAASSGDGHAHWVQWSPEGDRLYVVDLGHDEVRVYDYDAQTGHAAEPVTALKLSAKAGPRHMAFSPNGKFAYVLTEYANTLVAAKREADGKLTEIQTVSTLPADFNDKSYAAHITINAAGDRVYVTNRGHNSIAVFEIAPDGQLKHLQTVATGGDWPRFFLLLEAEKRLLVAHQNDHAITVFHLKDDGTLEATDKRFTSNLPVWLQPVS
ncbi:MAG: lactonase family protein [Asticcacaulis sp.]